MVERLAVAAFAAQAQEGAATRPGESDHAGLGARILAYLIDSVVLLCVGLLFAALAGLQVFAGSGFGNHNASDASYWRFVFILLLAAPFWLALNAFLLLRRGQTAGQYVVGLAVVTEQEVPLTARRALGYLLALHPLFFHPLLAAFWAPLAYVSVSLSSSDVIFVACLSVVALCLLAPLASLGSVLLDGQRRTLADRIAGTKLVRLA